MEISPNLYSNYGKKDQFKIQMFHNIIQLQELVEEGLYANALFKLIHDVSPKLIRLKIDVTGNYFGKGVMKKPWFIAPDVHLMNILSDTAVGLVNWLTFFR